MGRFRFNCNSPQNQSHFVLCWTRPWGRSLRKVAENFGQYAFSQPAKWNMAGFVLCLRSDLGLRCRMAGVCLKTPEIEFPAGKLERQQAPWKQHSALSRQQSAKPNSKNKTLLPQRAQRTRRKAKAYR